MSRAPTTARELMRRIDLVRLLPSVRYGAAPALGGTGLGADALAGGVLRRGAGAPDRLGLALAGSVGQPIPGAAHNRMRSFFGHDFGHVRIHTDPAASRMASQLRADAFTMGRDVYFGAGHSDFSSPQGLALLGHELTHVLQGEPGRADPIREIKPCASATAEDQDRAAEEFRQMVEVFKGAVRTDYWLREGSRQYDARLDAYSSNPGFLWDYYFKPGKPTKYGGCTNFARDTYALLQDFGPSYHRIDRVAGDFGQDVWTDLATLGAHAMGPGGTAAVMAGTLLAPDSFKHFSSIWPHHVVVTTDMTTGQQTVFDAWRAVGGWLAASKEGKSDFDCSSGLYPYDQFKYKRGVHVVSESGCPQTRDVNPAHWPLLRRIAASPRISRAACGRTIPASGGGIRFAAGHRVFGSAASGAEAQALRVESALLGGLQRAPSGRAIPRPPPIRLATPGSLGITAADLAGSPSPLQRKSAFPGARGRPGAFRDVERARALSPGAPLPEDLKGTFERYFGQDLSDVRVHEGARADRLAGRLGADAFTLGSDVFLPEGVQRTPSGLGLLAHELSHVAQQRGPGTRFTPGTLPGLEREAQAHEARFKEFASSAALGGKGNAGRAGLLPRLPAATRGPSVPAPVPRALPAAVQGSGMPGVGLLAPGSGQVTFIIPMVRLRVRGKAQAAQTKRRQGAEAEGAEARLPMPERRKRDDQAPIALDILTKSRLEAFLGAEVGDVRLHVGEAAGRAAHQLSAEAFTHGRDIYFAAGRFDPGSPEGMALLVHELVHVRQQMGGVAKGGEAATPGALEAMALRQEARYLRVARRVEAPPRPIPAAPRDMEVRKPPVVLSAPTAPTKVQKAEEKRPRSDIDPVDILMQQYGVTEGVEQEEFLDEVTKRVFDLMTDDLIMDEERRFSTRWR